MLSVYSEIDLYLPLNIISIGLSGILLIDIGLVAASSRLFMNVSILANTACSILPHLTYMNVLACSASDAFFSSISVLVLIIFNDPFASIIPEIAFVARSFT